MSQEIIIKTDNSTYAELIIYLAKKLGLNLTVNIKGADKKASALADPERIIREGGDMSYIPDPSKWQSEVRKDRKIL